MPIDGRCSVPLSEAELRLLFDEHVVELRSFARRRAGVDTGDEHVAETFARAFQKMPSELLLDERVRRAWLFKVLRNLITSAARHQAVVQRFAARFMEPEPAGSTDGHGLDLARLLMVLPERQRTVVELRFVYDLDVRTVASILSVGEEAVRALTHRALVKLREVADTRPPAITQPGRADEQ